MSFADLFGSSASSPDVLGSQTDSPASNSFSSPRKTNSFRKKRKQARLVNPAHSFEFSMKSEHSLDNSTFNLTGGRFLAELSPEPSSLSIEKSAPVPTSDSPSSLSPSSACANDAPVSPPPPPPPAPSDSPSPAVQLSTNTQQGQIAPMHSALSTTPDGTPERGISTRGASQSSPKSTSPQVDNSPSTSIKGNAKANLSSSSTFSADGSPIPSKPLVSRILSPIENKMGPIRVSGSPATKSYSSFDRTFSPLGKGTPSGKTETTASISLPQAKANLSMTSNEAETGDSGTQGATLTTPRATDRSTGAPSLFRDRPATPRTPGTPDSEREVENLTRSLPTFDMEFEDNYDDSFQHTPEDRSATIGPSPRRNSTTPTPPDVPSTPATSRFHPFDSGMVTPARHTGLLPQTPRSILRPSNTPATGNSVRFDAVTYYKVIERLPGFNEPSLYGPQESLGQEGTTSLGADPIEKSEVPMTEPSSSDEELDFQPTHHHSSLDSIDSDGFDDEVQRNTLANSQSLNDPRSGVVTEDEDGAAPYVSDTSLEATTKWLQNFVSSSGLGMKDERNAPASTQRTVSDSTTERTVSTSSLSPLDAEEPIRHTSPLNPPTDYEGDISNLDNLNNSSEWVVPPDLSFGEDSLPRLPGASFSIGAMVDPDVTEGTTRATTPLRRYGLSAWSGGDIPTISRSSPDKEDDMTPVATIRTRLAAAKYVSTSPLKRPTSPSSSRLGTSPKTSPPPLAPASLQRSHSAEEESSARIPILAISSPVPSPRKRSPSLPAVTEDDEREDSAEIKRKPVPPFFGSLSRSRSSPAAFAAGLRRSRSVFEDEDEGEGEGDGEDEDEDDNGGSESPVKRMLEGKVISSLGGAMSKLSLVDISSNVSKVSFLDRSESRVESSSSELNGVSASNSTGSANLTAASLAPHAQAVFDAQVEYAKSLEGQLARYDDILTKCQADLAEREVLLSKLVPMREDVLRMQDEMNVTRRANKDLKAQLAAVEESRDKLEAKINEAATETDDLKAQVADLNHVNEQLQAEVDALHSGKPSTRSVDDAVLEDLREKLRDSEDELAYARTQLQHTADVASHTRDQLASMENELLAARNESQHLAMELERVRSERGTAELELSAQLEATKEHSHDLAQQLNSIRQENHNLTEQLQSVQQESHDSSEQLAAARQEIDEFKTELRSTRDTISELKHTLNEAHGEIDTLDERARRASNVQHALDQAQDEIASLKAQLVDARAATTDSKADLGDARDECAMLTADLETARGDAEHFRSETAREARSRAEGERRIRSLEDQVKETEKTLADAMADIHRLMDERERASPLTQPTDPDAKDRRITLLEQKMRRLVNNLEVANVATNSAQMETEYLKRQLAAFTNPRKTLPLRGNRQSLPASAGAGAVPATAGVESAPRRVPT